MDNNLTNFGSEVYQPKEPINITYDAFAIPPRSRRGCSSISIRAESLTILPHIPSGLPNCSS